MHSLLVIFYVVLQPVSIILRNAEQRMGPTGLELGLLEKDRYVLARKHVIRIKEQTSHKFGVLE